MTYPPPNPYDPNQSPGYGQPSAPQHYTTDADPYSRPDPYSPGAGYQTAPSHPSSAPPGQPYSPGPAYAQTGGYQPPAGPPGGAFQPGQAAPPPPRGNSNTPLLITLVVIAIAVIGGGIMVGISMSGGDDPEPEKTSAAAETTEAAEETSEAAPTGEEETTAEGESVYRVPAEGECLENNQAGFYVVDCAAETAYWEVLKVVQSPADPEPTDPAHSVAAADACAGTGNTNYYYTDTAIAAGRDWDPEIDSITAVYCVKEV
ncbi:resistance to Congo red protein [Glycomyces luteolus]|uniref:Resistance to Congo red protein n=1 Tax=Glycomyces luteolus TaxID=2670330 RepID=A0A9X3P7X5_9ACTN|nr:resistance to Congo red protein [Glycomyces luteolus]MDA1360396.1 resistance to Congo red protein [Glycomyces luteolus]